MQHQNIQKEAVMSHIPPYMVLKCCVCFLNDIRVDTYISLLPLQLSRSQIRQLCSSIIVNKKKVKFSYAVQHGDYVEAHFDLPMVKKISEKEGAEHRHLSTISEAYALDIMYEDSVLMVLNKAKGQLVHSGNGHKDSITIADAVANKLLSYRKEDMLHARAGIVHRLDKDTSGSLLIAKTSEVHTILSKQFQERLVEKKYLAIVKGVPPKEQDTVIVNMERNRVHRKRFCVVPQGGRETVTQYQILFTNGKYTVLLYMPRTGRTHQLRVVAQHLGCPIIGDELYARKSQEFPAVKLMLHAWTISFYHPSAILTHLHTQQHAHSSLHKEREHNKSSYGVSDGDAMLRTIVQKLGVQATTYTSPVPADMQQLCKAIGYVI